MDSPGCIDDSQPTVCKMCEKEFRLMGGLQGYQLCLPCAIKVGEMAKRIQNWLQGLPRKLVSSQEKKDD